MRVCPKCHRTVADESKICRVCGSILNLVPTSEHVEVDLADQSSTVIPHENGEEDDLADLAAESREFEFRPWRCPNCQEVVEHNFDICWKCGTDRDGVKDLEFVVDREEGESEEDEPQVAKREVEIHTCVRCGSQRVVPHAPICDQGEHSDGRLYAMVIGNPDAVLFQDRMFGELRADICGDCGHVELRARHAARLYEHYLQSLEHRD